MKIGIDGRALTGRYTGDRTYWLNLLRAHVEAEEHNVDPENQYVVYSRLPIPRETLAHFGCITTRTIPASNDRLWTMLTFPKALREDRIEVAHTQYTTPICPPCPVVSTVHDISFRLYPGWFPRKHRLLLNLTVPRSMRRADMVITDSNSSRRDILRVYRLDPQRIVSIPLAAGPEYGPLNRESARKAVNEKYGFTEPYVLSVSVLQPRKNLPLLLEAFASARRRQGFAHKLVLTGKKGWGYESLFRIACRLNLNDALVMTDYVPDEDLPLLYSGADATAYPSLYEGFGLPPIESMACGTPTLVSDAPCLPEIAGEGAWVLPVIDPNAWADALSRILTDANLAKHWSERALMRSADFSWDRTSAATRKVYNQVAKCCEANQRTLEPPRQQS
jgi:glycosyltransferase involved in cell wall biosynthesis